jgi:hypothetical protein
MQEDCEAHAYPFPQQPPPIPTGQAWEFVEHANVVWRPVYVLEAVTTGDVVVTTVCIEDDWLAVIVYVVVTTAVAVEFITPGKH